jgi:sugar phosphate permease
VFVAQGLPASVLGIVAYFYLQDRPADAQWLTAQEKQRVQRDLSADVGTVAGARHASALALLRDPKVFMLSLVYFLLLGATYTMVFWLPTLVKSWGVSDLLMIGIYTAIPNFVGVVGMVLIGRSSDRLKERRWHFVACVCIAALGLGLTTLSKGMLGVSVAVLSLAVIGIASATPIFFAGLTEYLSKSSSAAGIALISSLGNLGPAVSPSITGWITARTGNADYSMYLVMALYLVAGALLLLSLRAQPAQD